ncbi:sulfotransferase [Jiella sonneratiae]|uniref:Sulfotransferase family protein n=1 Tax=Jiella sonneratiae TaxID=2816856 RepID=A0ABS3JDF9_9HYPH|nr:sulfotransferase [Jiella sonneratiae]MBO0906596.1 hypothetical protein [Jiella sonneratiae]
MKIFIIGMNKTATRSLHQFFKGNGVPSVHWDDGRLARAIRANIQNGSPPLQGYDDYIVFSDMELVGGKPGDLIEAYKYFRELDVAYPGSRFILNIRSPEGWLASRMNHSNGLYTRYYQRQYGGVNEADVLWRWRIDYYRHHADVLEYFSDKREQLIIFNIETDPIEALIERFADLWKLDAKWFGHKGKGIPRQMNASGH